MDVAEVLAAVLGYEGVLVLGEGAQHLYEGGHHSQCLQHLALEPVDPLRGVGLALAEDLELDRFDGLLDLVEHRRVGVDDAVGDLVEDRSGPAGQQGGLGLEVAAHRRGQL